MLDDLKLIKKTLTYTQLYDILTCLYQLDQNIVFTKFKFTDEYSEENSDSDSDDIHISRHTILQQF